MFIEPPAPRHWPLVLALFFVLLLIPNCWLPELKPAEAVTALIARDLGGPEGGPQVVRLLGRPTLTPPLASWLLGLVGWVLPVNEFTIRLVGLVPLGLLAWLCGWIVTKRVGVAAGAATAAVVCSSFVALEKGPFGTGDFWFCLLLCAAWFAWYELSHEHKRWFYAWVAGHLLTCLAALAGGAKAFFFFYLAVLFQRRPVGSWRRLWQREHGVSLALAFLLLLGWVMLMPGLNREVWLFFCNFEAQPPAVSYLKHLAGYPFQVLLGLVPWVFLAWPAFCMGFRPVERDPVRGHFLRTVVYALFLFFWFLPEGRASLNLPLLGPLAILVGLNYDVLVRRYGRQLYLVPRVLCWAIVIPVGFAVAAVLGFLGTCPLANLPSTVLIPSLCFLLLGVALATIVSRHRETWPVWLLVLAAVTALNLAVVAVNKTYAYACLSPKRTVAQRLVVGVEPGVRVYEMISPQESFAAECFYLDRPVTKISDLSELPVHEPVVYVLGRQQVPLARSRPETGRQHEAALMRLYSREWTAVSDVVLHTTNDTQYKLRMWRGERKRAVHAPPPA